MTAKWLQMIKSAFFVLPTVIWHKVLRSAGRVYAMYSFSPELCTKTGVCEHGSNAIQDCQMNSFQLDHFEYVLQVKF